MLPRESVCDDPVRDPQLRRFGAPEASSASLLAVIVLGLIALAIPAPLPAQDDEFVPEGEEVEAAPDFDAIDEMLAVDEEVLHDPGTYSYDPGARRDPFRSLLAPRSPTDRRDEEERPEGPPGLLIDEIQIEGIFVLPDGPVAQIQSSSSQTSYLLHPGDQLWDGDVVSISLNEVVFKQSVNDPTALKPFREVTKRLTP